MSNWKLLHIEGFNQGPQSAYNKIVLGSIPDPVFGDNTTHNGLQS